MVQRILLGAGIRVTAAAVSASALVSGCAGPSTAVIDGPSFATHDGRNPLRNVYRLGVGDKLKVTVFGEENLSGQFEVGANGNISMPLVGDIPAKGLSVPDLRAAIIRRLAGGYLKNPKITVEMMNYRPIFVQGEVKNGGEFSYKAGVSLRDAIAMAGGYTYRADETYVLIGRGSAPDVAVRTPSNMQVLPGDNIRVPERFF